MSIYRQAAKSEFVQELIFGVILVAATLFLIYLTLNSNGYGLMLTGIVAISVAFFFRLFTRKRIREIETSDELITFRFMMGKPDQVYRYEEISVYRSARTRLSGKYSGGGPGPYYLEIEFNDGFSFGMSEDGAKEFWEFKREIEEKRLANSDI